MNLKTVPWFVGFLEHDVVAFTPTGTDDNRWLQVRVEHGRVVIVDTDAGDIDLLAAACWARGRGVLRVPPGSRLAQGPWLSWRSSVTIVAAIIGHVGALTAAGFYRRLVADGAIVTMRN